MVESIQIGWNQEAQVEFFVDVVKLDNSLKYIPSTLEKSVKKYSFDMDEMYLKYFVLFSLTYS